MDKSQRQQVNSNDLYAVIGLQQVAIVRLKARLADLAAEVERLRAARVSELEERDGDTG